MTDQRRPNYPPRTQPRPQATARHAFVYKERDPDTLRQRAEWQGGKFDTYLKQGYPIWRAKAGENCIRFLPPTWTNFNHYGLTFWAHQYVGVESGSYMCLEHMQGKPCPICAAYAEAKRNGDEAASKQLNAVQRVVTWILDRKGDATKPQLFVMSRYMDRDIVALCKDRKTGGPLWVDNPDIGFDVWFERIGTDFKTRYGAYQIDREQSPISSDKRIFNDITDYITENPLDQVLLYRPAEYLQRALLGIGASEAPPPDNRGSQLLQETYEEGTTYEEPGYEQTGEVQPEYEDDPPLEDDGSVSYGEPEPEPAPPQFQQRGNGPPRVQLQQRPPSGGQPPRRPTQR